jgi:tRNA (cmo5U34)-methyltransferase
MMGIQEQFDAAAKDYDRQRRLFIPCFDDFYGMAVENLVLTGTEPAILDIGAGTGLLAEMALRKYPSARMELIDISPEMLQIAKLRLQPYPNVTITRSDISSVEISSDWYDAIVSSLAIHHLADEDKVTLYHKIYRGLKNGGIFIHAEQVLASNRHLQEVYQAAWLKKIARSGLPAKALEQGLERVKLDKRTPLEIQLNWLKEIGFVNVDCRYKYYDFAVMKAEK